MEQRDIVGIYSTSKDVYRIRFHRKNKTGKNISLANNYVMPLFSQLCMMNLIKQRNMLVNIFKEIKIT